MKIITIIDPDGFPHSIQTPDWARRSDARARANELQAQMTALAGAMREIKAAAETLSEEGRRTNNYFWNMYDATRRLDFMYARNIGNTSHFTRGNSEHMHRLENSIDELFVDGFGWQPGFLTEVAESMLRGEVEMPLPVLAAAIEFFRTLGLGGAAHEEAIAHLARALVIAIPYGAAGDGTYGFKQRIISLPGKVEITLSAGASVKETASIGDNTASLEFEISRQLGAIGPQLGTTLKMDGIHFNLGLDGIGAGVSRYIDDGVTLTVELGVENLELGGNLYITFKSETSTEYFTSYVSIQASGNRKEQDDNKAPAVELGWLPVPIPIPERGIIPTIPTPPLPTPRPQGNWLPEGWTTITIPDIPAYVPSIPQDFRSPEIPWQAIAVISVTGGVITIAGGVLKFSKTGCTSGIKAGAQQIEAAFAR